MNRFGEMPRQLEWRDSGGVCHLQDLTVPLCSVCNKTWHIGDTAIVTDTGLRYKCECWQPWESFDMDENDPPYEPRSLASP